MNNFEYKNLTPFKWFVLENFPFIEADFDALTEWQLFCKLGKEINKIINSENTLGTQMENVTNAFINLQNYVNNYFDNLDVQEEINTKLNEMVEDGTFTRLIFENLNYVTYEMFGAKLNGINDDTQAIIDCHNYANLHNLKVIQNKGIAYMPTATINNCPIINTDCDFNGLTFKFDNNNDNNTVIIIAEPDTLTENKDDINFINLTPSQISELNGNNTNDIQFLQNYKNHHIIFDTNMSFGKRNDPNDDSILYYKQPFIVNDLAQLAPNNMYANIDSNATSVKMRYLSLKQKYINIRFGKISINGNTSNNPRILIMRNNITLENAIIEKINYTNTTIWKHSLFDVKYSANIEVKNFTGNTPVSEDTSVDTTAYVITFNQCTNVYFLNNKLLKGHGAIASYYVNDFTFKGNYINRFDNHYGAFGNYIIKDNNFVGYPCRINFGFGNANVTIDSCNFYKYQENNKRWIDDIVLCRSDLGVMFSGTINISNCKIEGKRNTNNDEYVTLFQWITAHTDETIYPIWANYNMPHISIENIQWFVTNLQFRVSRIINNNTQIYNLRNINFNLTEHGSQGKSQFSLDNINIDNSKIMLNNADLKILTTTNLLHIDSYKNVLIESIPTNINLNNYGNTTLTRNYNTINNYSQLTLNANTIINTLNNYSNCSTNNVQITNLNSNGVLSGSEFTTENGFISGKLLTNKITNNGNIVITGCFININNLINTDKVITMTGCNMYSSKALLFQNNGSVVGYGNYAAGNTNIINSYTP